MIIAVSRLVPLARRSIVAVAAALIGAVFYVVAPVSQAVESILVIMPLTAAVLIGLGVITHKPARRDGWVLIGGAMCLQGVAAAVRSAKYFADEPTFPTVVAAVGFVAMLLLLAGIALLTLNDRESDDTFGPIETAIVAIATTVVVWMFVIEPVEEITTAAPSDKIWATATPLVAALAFSLSIRLVSQGRFRQPAPLAVAAGALFIVVSSTARNGGRLREAYQPGGVVEALAIVGVMLFAAAALDPSMALRARRTPAAAGVSRVVGLSIAALTPLTVLSALIVADVGSAATRIITTVGALVVVLLSLTRMWGLVATVRSLTERRGQDRLAAMVEHSTDVVVLTDDDGDIRYASPGLTATLGHRPEDWLGRPLIDLVVSEDRNLADVELSALVAMGRGGTVKFEASLVRVDGERRRMESTIANLIGGDAVDGIVATFRDVTAQRELERQLSQRAFHDDLTGLVNRSLFIDLMNQALSMGNTNEEPVVVLFVDLDDFKAVNDALGHAVGDELLCHIADRIRLTTEPGDTPARLGGDEFAILLRERGGLGRAMSVGTALLEALAQPINLAGYELAVLASVGVAISVPGMTTTAMLRDADIAMYEAKRSGKGQIKVFDPAMRLGATQHLEFRADLGRAIERSELHVVFQPQFDLATGQFCGAEALVRWRHPVRGEVPPSEFIPVAERAGLILPIGSWVLDESVRQAAGWQGSGRHEVSVNVSALQLRVPDFVDQVRATLERHRFPPELLTLEITETALVDEIEAASRVLADLRAAGVRVAIDDFGTGYCSLSYLKRFPVDVIKIDRQFVEELGDDDRTSSLANMILQMTSSLGVTSVAEGIERPEQMVALQRMGCDIGQGYLLASPMDGAAITKRLASPTRIDSNGASEWSTPAPTVGSLSA